MAPPRRLVKVTYVPIHDDDRLRMVWNGITFQANVPVELDRKNRAHFYQQLVRHETKHPQTGGTAYSYTEKLVFMGDAAKGNPSFEVDGVRLKHIVPSAKVPPAGAEWFGTNRDELVPAGEVPWPDDIPEGADAIEISR